MSSIKLCMREPCWWFTEQLQQEGPVLGPCAEVAAGQETTLPLSLLHTTSEVFMQAVEPWQPILGTGSCTCGPSSALTHWLRVCRAVQCHVPCQVTMKFWYICCIPNGALFLICILSGFYFTGFDSGISRCWDLGFFSAFNRNKTNVQIADKMSCL